MTPPNKTRVTAFIIIYLAGMFTQGALFVNAAYWTFETQDLQETLIGLIAATTQGIALLKSEQWWLPICTKLTKLQPKEHHDTRAMD
ncbi:membrane protein [Corynebacterium phage PSonyx]|nr:membrane protein [Corynebacterium phage PSonyx]